MIAVLFRSVLVGLVMLLSVAGVALGSQVSWSWAPFLGGVVGIALGVLVARPVKERWDPLNRTPATMPPTFPVDPNA